jgi:hypothetical protein
MSMSERFNFYDIYGYLLPGLLLLGLCWLPFGLAGQGWPNQEVSKALLLLFAGYIAGHLLQSFALVIVPSKVRDSKGVLRSPSSILLDEDSKFDKNFKTLLANEIRDAFGLEVLGTGTQEANRDVAVMQARAYLIRNKSANYVEQFEGLYAMLRGLGCAFFFGASYFLGWILSFHWNAKCLGLEIWLLLIIACVGGLVLSTLSYSFRADSKKERSLDRWGTAFILVLALALGYFLGTWKPAPSQAEFFLCVALPVALIAGVRCMRGYRRYAQLFAETVWRDFSALHRDLNRPVAEGATPRTPSSEPTVSD